jgi:tRNA pseudouridine38-40 synthase
MVARSIFGVLFVSLVFLPWKLLGTAALSLTEQPQTLRYRCRVAYDGTGYSGFQLQPNPNQKEQRRTIQGELERTLSQRFDRLVRVVGAGRTDAGVHSRGQAIHFDLYRNETTTETIIADDNNKVLQTAMNRMLPQDIRVWKVEQAHLPREELVNGKKRVLPWNVMRKCNAKLYSYRLCIGDSMDPLERHYRWQLDWGHEIDPEYLGKILKLYEGTHNFVCFAGALESNERKTGKRMGTIRTIHKINLIKQTGNDLYRIDIYLEGALYKMVRNMVGTALEVCRGRMTEDEFLEILHHPENLSRKDNPSKPAPPQGLTLEHVFYPDDKF